MLRMNLHHSHIEQQDRPAPWEGEGETRLHYRATCSCGYVADWWQEHAAADEDEVTHLRAENVDGAND
jgi:hypothetical protein